MIGKTISHYRILEKLGEGGMGVVYKAEDENLHRPVALKFLRVDAVGDHQMRGRFWKEAEAAAALDHPNITTIYEIGEADGQTFIAMALIDGEDLAAKIKHRPLPFDEALRITVQAAEALQAAHERGIVHRDIKPSNIMITPEGRVKVMDFGLAHLAGQTRITKTGTIMGTPAYMSPEQARGEEVDHRSDIWSLGVLLYEMVTGKLPFLGNNDQAVLLGIINDAHEPMTAIRVGTPPELDRVVAKALAKSPEERYSHVDDMLVDLRILRKNDQAGATRTPAAVAGQRRNWAAMIAAALALVGATVGLTWWFMRMPPPSPQRTLTRLTTDSGLSGWPALSPNGDLVAYGSDRAGDGNLDIWVKQIAGGESIRLTRNAADDYEPAFSPDGSQLAFRSDRQGGGVYLVSALGGEPRLIAPRGAAPRFSPDDNWIIYRVGPTHVDNPRLQVVPRAGGSSRPFQPEFFGARNPVWSPDGKHVIFFGRQKSSEGYDWWVAPMDGGAAVRTGARSTFARHDLGFPSPAEWIGEDVVFSARLGDSTNIWRIRISSGDWQVSGDPERLTLGSGLEAEPRIGSGDRLVFSSLRRSTDIWSLAVEANEGKVTGEVERLTSDAATSGSPRLSADGKQLVFESNRSGSRDIWIKDLDSGGEVPLTFTSSRETHPVIAPDGSIVAYGVVEDRKWAIHVVPASGGVAEKICDDCGNPMGWSAGNRKVLYSQSDSVGDSRLARPYSLDIATGQRTRLVQHPRRRIHDPTISHDGSWIAFHIFGATPGTRQIFVVPFRDEKDIPESEWIAVTDGSELDRSAGWSPDGGLLYFHSERDGYRCIWAQRLDRTTKATVGAPFPVYHFHQSRQSLLQTIPQQISISVGGDKLVFGMAETTGNIWMAAPAEAGERE